MEFVDLAAQQREIRQALDHRIRAVLDHGEYIMGPEVAELEGVLGAFVGVRHALGCASGTDALLLACMMRGVGPGDIILTTPFTFIATAEVVSLLGATPVFVDIDPVTFNIDPDGLERTISELRGGSNSASLPAGLSARLGKMTVRGVIAVNIFGVPADYDRISDICRRNELFLVEDAAQSLGAEYKGKKSGSFGDIACTSFFPAKPLGCYGDGGMCFTNDDHAASVLSSLRVHGKGKHKYDCARIGINGRLDTLQAAVLLAKLEVFQEELVLRDRVADRYTELLRPYGQLVAPSLPKDCRSAWAQYSVLFRAEAERHQAQEKAAKAGIPTAVYYPKPLHLQTAFADLGYAAGCFPVSEHVSRCILSLPMHPYLSEVDQQRVVQAVAGEE